MHIPKDRIAYAMVFSTAVVDQWVHHEDRSESAEMFPIPVSTD